MDMIKRMVVAFALLISLPLVSTAQQESVPEDIARKAAELFPEITGAFALSEKVSAQLADIGVKIINYNVLIGGKKVGEVSRIVSLIDEGIAANVDVLARYDDKGVIQGIVPLKPWKAGSMEYPGSQDISFLLLSMKGHDLRNQQASLNAMLNGISAGAALSDGMAPPAPEGGYPLTVRQLLLEPGTKLPSLKMKDLAGNDIDASSYKDKKLLIAFISPENARSRDMTQAIEAVTAGPLKQNSVSLIYVISSTPEKSREYSNGLGLNGVSAADPAGILGKMFMVPYNPYLFLFDKGVLASQLKWEGEGALREQFSQFLRAGNRGARGVKK